MASPSPASSSFSLSSLPFYASCRGDVDAKTCPPPVHPFTVGLTLTLPILRIAAEQATGKLVKKTNFEYVNVNEKRNP